MHKNYGTFCWYELMTTDVPAAERFYVDVVGWSMRDSGMDGMKYTLAYAGDAQADSTNLQAGQGQPQRADRRKDQYRPGYRLCRGELIQPLHSIEPNGRKCSNVTGGCLAFFALP